MIFWTTTLMICLICLSLWIKKNDKHYLLIFIALCSLFVIRTWIKDYLLIIGIKPYGKHIKLFIEKSKYLPFLIWSIVLLYLSQLVLFIVCISVGFLKKLDPRIPKSTFDLSNLKI